MAARSETIASLKNLGPTIAKRLAAVGIRTRSDLERVGPASVFIRVRDQFPDETISVCYYLYSLEGALRDLHWDKIGETRKRRLRSLSGID
jgi:DNA transformation protein